VKGKKKNSRSKIGKNPNVIENNSIIKNKFKKKKIEKKTGNGKTGCKIEQIAVDRLLS